ncbi:MAG: LysR family transcriptional regulator, partial [Serratia proteamaculans]
MKANSDELITFVTVVESGSFSRAAEQLAQANSVVSRTVKKLETKLGVTLLNRTTRQISLTQEGENYFRQVQKVLSDMAAAENALMESRQRP